MQTKEICWKLRKRYRPCYPVHHTYTGHPLMDDVIAASQNGHTLPVDIEKAAYILSWLEYITGNHRISIMRTDCTDLGHLPPLNQWQFVVRNHSPKEIIQCWKAFWFEFNMKEMQRYEIKDIEKIEASFAAGYDSAGNCWADYLLWIAVPDGTFCISRHFSPVKSVPGYPHLWVSREGGQVFRMDATNIKHCAPLKSSLQGQIGNQYLAINLSINNLDNNLKVHRLVAKTWCNNPNQYDVVNHIDEDKLNNDASNLEFCTILYNTRYSILLSAIKKAMPDVDIIANHDMIADTVWDIVNISADEEDKQSIIDSRIIQLTEKLKEVNEDEKN